MNKFWEWLKSFWTPAVSAAAQGVAAGVFAELGTIGMQIMLSKAGALKQNPAYVGADGGVKVNAVRDELIRYASGQGIALSQQMLDALVARVAQG